jgi:hypothetical protein
LTKIYSEKFPVAIFTFNRPDFTRRVLDEIKRYGPPVIYLIQDGPRMGNAKDAENCSKVRDILESVDWTPKIHKVYADENLGLLESFERGLRHVFTNSEDCIILEDDCLPSQAFFRFVSHGLNEFRHDKTIGMIHGYSDLPPSHLDLKGYPSRAPKVWGWASWADRWAGFSAEKSEFEHTSIKESSHIMSGQGFTFLESIRWRRNLNRAVKIDTWDYQWVFHILQRFGYSIAPNQNLILNLGFGADSSHTVLTPPFVQFSIRSDISNTSVTLSKTEGHSLDKRESRQRWISMASLRGLKVLIRKVLS